MIGIIILILMIVVIYKASNSLDLALKRNMRKGQSIILSQKFSDLGDLKSYSYEEIINTCGKPGVSQLIKDENGVDCYKRIWGSVKYEITIIFEMDNTVRHVEKEVYR